MKKAANGKQPKKQRAPAKGGSAHKLAAELPEGFVLTDLRKKQWKLGKPIGRGGFGLIYLTEQCPVNSVSSNAPYVMKLEPHDNGPLFCELNFYQRAAKPEYIKEWMNSKKLKTLGMPHFIAAGNHEHNGAKYRFMVMQRFGVDLQKKFEENGKLFPSHTVFHLGLKLLDVLEYIHSKGYAHADIKASNILRGFTDPDVIYLIDYGLAYRYNVEGTHKEYKEDPRKAHDGTIEFTSRDAHKGVCPSRRGDLEILGYCMLQWLCGKLPWEDKLTDKEYVKNKKISCMKDTYNLVKTCCPNCPEEMVSYMNYVSNLKYDEDPNYSRCRQWFVNALKVLGHKENEKLQLDISATKATPGKKRPMSPASRATSSGPSPPKARKTSPTKQPSSPMEDSEEESEAENKVVTVNRKRSWPKAKKEDGKRVWPKAKKTPSDSLSPVAIARQKELKDSNTGGGVNSPVKGKQQANQRTASPAINGKRTPVGKSRSPLAKVKASDPSISDTSASPIDIARAKANKPSPKVAKVVRKKRATPAQLSTIATQTSPGLGGLARTQNKSSRLK